MNKVKNEEKKQDLKEETFGIVVKEWLRDRKKEVKESTFSHYRYVIKKYLIGELGDDSIESMEKKNYNELIEKLSQELSTKTVRDIIIILRSILEYANANYGYNIKIQQIKVPKLEQEPIIILNKNEQDRMRVYCLKENSLRSIGIFICLSTGLRIGEICALKWNNIDLEKREIRIRNTLQRIYDEDLKQTKVVIDKPKTRTSIRNIPISNKLYNILKEIEKDHHEDDFFLTGSSELHIEPRIYRDYFKKILRKSKIKNHYKFHILRHTFATNCIEVGMDTKSLSEILGHATIEMTLNKYVHSSFERKKKFLEKI
ncbi:MAG: site-specific integrase [Clostridia bacterium]|nr:site-specific integrase [Clostridia bacterium]